MELRRWIFRIMFWALGCAAALGVTTALIGTNTFIFRTIGTAAGTAVACWLMLPCSAMINRPKVRLAGSLALSIIFIEYLLLLEAIWEISTHMFGWNIDDQIYLTMAWLACWGICAVLLLILATWQPGLQAAQVGLVITAINFAIGMGVTWIEPAFTWENKWRGTCFFLGVGGGLAVACLIRVGEKDHWKWIGILASVLGSILAIVGIWNETDSELGASLLTILLTVGICTAYMNLIRLCKVSKGQRWILMTTVAALLWTAFFVDWIIIDDIYNAGRFRSLDSFAPRLASAGGILAGCGTLAVMILNQLNRRGSQDIPAHDFSDIVLHCPRCSKKQRSPLGESRCLECGLMFVLHVETPCCGECGYLLYGSTSDKCPECGTPIP